MNRIKKRTFALALVMSAVSLPFFWYLALPGIGFPSPPPGALESREPADIEDTNRRAYFTNLTRSEVITHYERELSGLPILKFNYPPEEAQSIIRDQTRSTYLEEIAHPFRESIFINGFEPREDKDRIYVAETEFAQKVTVRYVPSNPIYRIFVGAASVAVFVWFLKELYHVAKR